MAGKGIPMSGRGLFICACLASLLCEFAGAQRRAGAAPANAPIENQEPPGAPAIITDQTPAELLRARPELAGLEPAASQEILPQILRKVGANVESYFHSVVSTCAREETTMERVGLDGSVEETFKQTFRYLAIPHPERGPLNLEEYRTSENGRPPSGAPPKGIVLTAGFVYLPVYLHPVYRDQSDFSYVGRQTVEDHNCYVIAFAQVPETAHLWAHLTEGLASYAALLQGLVWVDATSFQIIRLYTELLPNQPLHIIKEQTTLVTYGEVRFKGIDVVLWLPRAVVVYTAGAGRRFRNFHRYSNYQLYTSQTKLIY
jgi:hypothetical protein